MYKKSIKLLEKYGVELKKGLTYDEIVQVEKIYDIKFPNSLQKLLTMALPVSKGFYNWRNFKEDNVNFIKQVINTPIEDIYDMAESVDWCDSWGKEPKDEEDIAKEVKKRLKNAPKLIPVFSHRYIPMILDENPPIISIHGVDIIYYGKDLKDYFEIEFENKRQDSILFSNIKPIPFWSDLM